MNRSELINVDVSRTLAHVALLAAWDGDSESANRIFSALYAARPTEPNIRICQAMVLACEERFSDCIELLNGVLRDAPANLNAKSLLGLIKFFINEQGWRRLLEEVVADGSDVHAVEMARRILAENPASSSFAQGGPAVGHNHISYA